MFLEDSNNSVRISHRADENHSDSHVEGPIHFRIINSSLFLYQPEHFRGRWEIVEFCTHLRLGDYAVKFCEAPARNVGEAVNLRSSQCFQNRLDIDSSRFENLLSNTPTKGLNSLA